MVWEVPLAYAILLMVSVWPAVLTLIVGTFVPVAVMVKVLGVAAVVPL